MTGRARRRVVAVEAPAKLNLGLAVGPPRGDGFHDLVTVFQTISLTDTLVARPRARGFSLAVRTEPTAAARGRTPHERLEVPEGAHNLVLRAARALAAHDPRIGGAHFELLKRIPAQAGLGGGSADAAAALLALDALHGIRRPAAERRALAATLGSDVPFALFGGTALGRGRGERLERLRLARPFRAVVVLPAWGISTARAYAAIDRSKSALTQWGRALRIARNLRTGAVALHDAMRLGNAFEDVLGDRRAGFAALSGRMRAAGADPVRMTGSGSAVFGILGPGSTYRQFLRRFTGDETIFQVRTRGAGARLRMLPKRVRA
jgi:4-diphosphocytidyl-2-C-methyl-D-erythritol kinase